MSLVGRFKFKKYIKSILFYLDKASSHEELDYIEIHVNSAIKLNNKFKIKGSDIKW